MTETSSTLASEHVIINAPMSFTGAAQRTWRLTGLIQRKTGLDVWGRRIALIPFIAVPVLLAWWALIIPWYLVFGILLVPYRLLRRGSRKRKAEALRHREMLSAIDQSKER